MTQPQNPAEDPELDELAATGQDEYARGADEDPGAVSIDDALEADRAAAEEPDPQGADGYGVDAARDRGGDDATAAEQGNREQDQMEADDGEQELPEDLPEEL